jgi:hypothetical protein
MSLFGLVAEPTTSEKAVMSRWDDGLGDWVGSGQRAAGSCGGLYTSRVLQVTRAEAGEARGVGAWVSEWLQGPMVNGECRQSVTRASICGTSSTRWPGAD